MLCHKVEPLLHSRRVVARYTIVDNSGIDSMSLKPGRPVAGFLSQTVAKHDDGRTVDVMPLAEFPHPFVIVLRLCRSYISKSQQEYYSREDVK